MIAGLSRKADSPIAFDGPFDVEDTIASVSHLKDKMIADILA